MGLARAGCGAICLCAIGVRPAHAQCGGGYLGLQAVLAQDSVAVMFVGVTHDIERIGPAEIITFAAERAWKGPVTEQMIIYRPIAVPPAPPPTRPDGRGWAPGEFNPVMFQRGERYMVIAHRLSDAERNQLGVTQLDVFGTDVCGDGSRPVLEAGLDLANIGHGRVPTCAPGATLKRDFPVLIAGECGKASPAIKIADAAPVYRIYGRVQGVVILSITIDETGSVSRAQILRSIPLYDQAAIDCVMKWKYLPGLIDGVPAPAVLTINVPFLPSR